MPLSVTGPYAGILALVLIALAINVTVHRVKLKVPLGDGNNVQMRRMIRLHGNGGGHGALHIAGLALVVGRLAQTWGMWSTDMTTLGRQIGQSLTWLSLIAL